jgi:hypothetical protein
MRMGSNNNNGTSWSMVSDAKKTQTDACENNRGKSTTKQYNIIDHYNIHTIITFVCRVFSTASREINNKIIQTSPWREWTKQSKPRPASIITLLFPH